MLPVRPQRGAQKCKAAIFPLKLHFTQRKSATKFRCVNTVSKEGLWHSLAYLIVQKWLVWDVPVYIKFWQKLTDALSKMPIFSRCFLVSVSAVTPTEKVQLT